RLRPVPHALDLIALAREIEARELDDVLLVVDDHDLRAHRSAHGVKFIMAASTGCLTNVRELQRVALRFRPPFGRRASARPHAAQHATPGSTGWRSHPPP